MNSQGHRTEFKVKSRGQGLTSEIDFWTSGVSVAPRVRDGNAKVIGRVQGQTIRVKILKMWNAT